MAFSTGKLTYSVKSKTLAIIDGSLGIPVSRGRCWCSHWIITKIMQFWYEIWLGSFTIANSINLKSAIDCVCLTEEI